MVGSARALSMADINRLFNFKLLSSGTIAIRAAAGYELNAVGATLDWESACAANSVGTDWIGIADGYDETNQKIKVCVPTLLTREFN